MIVLNTTMRFLKWLHSRPYCILIVAGIIVAVIGGTYFDWSRILINSQISVGGVGAVVGLHILGVVIVVFSTHKCWLEKHLSHSSRNKLEDNVAHDHHNTIVQTKGEIIRWAPFYDAIVWLLSLGKGRAIRKVTIELAQIKPGDMVLDVGCGTGDLTMVAKAVTGSTGMVYGIDASEEMIDVAQRKATRGGVDVTFQVDVIEKISFPDNQFDLVLSSFMMHHLPDDALKQQGLVEIFRVLKPGGRILIVDIASSNQTMTRSLADFMVHVHGGYTAIQNTIEKLAPLMETAGFTDLETGVLPHGQIAFIAGKKDYKELYI